MGKNKWIAFLLIGALSMSLLAGCNANNGQGEQQDAAPEGNAAADEGKVPAVTGELLDAAKLMVDGAQAKAAEIGVPMVISVVDMDGNLVLLHRMEGSLLASLEIAPNKAYTAAALKMPSAAVKELAQEGQELQSIAVSHAGRIVEFGGGLPIYDADGVQIGGIGVSGGSVAEDTSVAQAGLDAYAAGNAPAPVPAGELLDQAIVMVAAAEQKSMEIGVPMVISVVDMGGNVVLVHRMENSLLASLEIAQNKAYTAAALKMPSAAVKDLAQAGQELQSIAVSHAGRIVEFGGGLPIYDENGVQIGGIGVSGGSVEEDTSVAQAGLDALKN